MNCAFCHLSTLRTSAEDKSPEIIPGMPGNTVDVEKFFLFLFAAVSDPRFTADEVMKEVLKQNPDMNVFHRILYRYVLVPALRHYTLQLKKEFDFIDPQNPKRLPEFGPGRVAPWDPGKVSVVSPRLPVEYPSGIVDHMSAWNQKARGGMRLHWDGNIDRLEERNIVAALVVVGPRVNYLDYPRLQRLTDWLTWLPAPRYEDHMYGNAQFAIRWDLVDRGKSVFQLHCAACHAPGGDRTGRVEPVDSYQLRTDPERIKSFTPDLANALNQLGTATWKLRNFKPQKGYVNVLLDGIWLRAPYLHNGSVPTLRDLLNGPEARPRLFCRGSDVFDRKNVGFMSAPVQTNGTSDCGEFFLYDTTVPGNSNKGHLYGTYLGKDDKDALVEFLKTL